MTTLRVALPLPALLAAIAIVGLVELALLRLLYRIGLFIPREGPFLDLYRLATWLGSFAFDLATVLALAALLALALLSWPARRPEAVTLGALLLLAVVVPFVPTEGEDLGRAAFATSALAAVAAIVARSLQSRPAPLAERVAVLAIAAVVATAQWRVLVEVAAWVSGTTAVGASPVAPIGEGAALIAALALAAAALRSARPARRALLAAAVATAAPAAALVAWPHLTGIVLLWSAGLTLALPLPLYLGALAALLVAIAAELRRPERRPRAAAMAILLAAGVVPQSSTHALLAVVALAALAERDVGTVLTKRTIPRDVYGPLDRGSGQVSGSPYSLPSERRSAGRSARHRIDTDLVHRGTTSGRRTS